MTEELNLPIKTSLMTAFYQETWAYTSMIEAIIRDYIEINIEKRKKLNNILLNHCFKNYTKYKWANEINFSKIKISWKMKWAVLSRIEVASRKD